MQTHRHHVMPASSFDRSESNVSCARADAASSFSFRHGPCTHTRTAGARCFGRQHERTTTSKDSSTVATYTSHSDAAAAVKELQKSGFDMKKLSIVGCAYRTDEQLVGCYNAGDRMKYWGKLGVFWGGIWARCFLVPHASGFLSSVRC